MALLASLRGGVRGLLNAPAAGAALPAAQQAVRRFAAEPAPAEAVAEGTVTQASWRPLEAVPPLTRPLPVTRQPMEGPVAGDWAWSG
jgi:hypothetical protein